MTEYLTPHNFQLAAIALEAVVAIVCLLAARRGRTYMYGLFISFAVYVYYDAARLYVLTLIPANYQQALFLLAAVTALISAFGVYRRAY